MIATFTSHTLPIWANWSQFLGIIPLAAGAIGLYLKHTCHMPLCFRPAWHEHPAHGHPVCKRHHPDDAHALKPAP